MGLIMRAVVSLERVSRARVLEIGAASSFVMDSSSASEPSASGIPIRLILAQAIMAVVTRSSFSKLPAVLLSVGLAPPVALRVRFTADAAGLFFAEGLCSSQYL